MAVFKYEARNLEGAVIKGSLEATNKNEVIENLRQRQYFPLKIEVENKSRDVDLDFLNKITAKDLSLFCRQFGFILEAGTPILRGLELSIQQCDNKKLKLILKRVHDQVQRGRSLSDALKFEDEIPDLMVNMIAAGESSGKLDYVLRELSDYYKKIHKQQQKVSQATMYPKLVIGFAVVVVGFLLTFVVPSFIDNLLGAGGELPLITKGLLAVSMIFKKFWYIMLMIVGLLYGFKVYFLDKDQEYIEKAAKRRLYGKLFGKVNRQIIAGRFANTFSILSGSGMGIISSLETTAKVLENKYVEKKINQATEDIKKGNPIGKTIEDLDVFPAMLTQMITIGEETGMMDDILKKTSEYYDGEVEAALEKMVATIEPMLIMGLAVIVLFIVLALLLPMMNMMNAINGMK